MSVVFLAESTNDGAFLAAIEQALAFPDSDEPISEASRRRNEEAVRNARLAVEWDSVRLGLRLADRRLAAAVCLAPRIIVCEALLAGPPVPARRLDRRWVSELHLTGDVVLDDELALRVVAHGPIGDAA